MGMFDTIDYKMKCPVCGNEVDGFQSKDKDCTLGELKVWQVDNFYASCDVCESWIEFNLKDEARKKFTIDDYEMEYRKADTPKVECHKCGESVTPIFARVCPKCNAKITKWLDDNGD